MPFKANSDRRHHIPKQRHRVSNWAAYDAGLRARGSLGSGHESALSVRQQENAGNSESCGQREVVHQSS